MNQIRKAHGRRRFEVVVRQPHRKRYAIAEQKGLVERPKFFEDDSGQWWKGRVRPKRDSFVQRIYDAENKFWRGHPQREKLADIAEVARMVRGFIERDWFQRRFPRFLLCVVEYVPQKRAWAHAGPRQSVTLKYGSAVTSGYMAYGPRAMTNWVVLHELAHAVLPSGHHHDRRWVRTYVEFVGAYFGQDTKKGLVKAFRDAGIKMTPYRVVKTTPEMLDRLAAARAAAGRGN
jgi:putative metallohydrolase (TIGR04338 family)